MRCFLTFVSIVAIAICCSCGGDKSASSPDTSGGTTPSIAINPQSARVAVGGVQHFSATIVGLANTAVAWSIQEGATGGAIDSTGKYTAPMTVGTYHVTAQSQASASLSAVAAITVFQPGQAQGAYTGTYSFGMAFYAVVLPNDMFYSIEGNTAADGRMTHVFRLGSGQGNSTEGNYGAALKFVLTDTSFNSSLQAQYVPGTSLTGSISNATFTATALPLAQLDFNTPANLSHITGNWTGLFLEDMLTGEPATGEIMISAAGQITPVGSGCSYSGTITPDMERNFFDVSITFAAAPCNPANGTISGVAVEMLLPDGVTRQLLIIMKESTFGFAGLR